jgi:regulator of protease activity HflC (stomatin/prohibitin superfamily)
MTTEREDRGRSRRHEEVEEVVAVDSSSPPAPPAPPLMTAIDWRRHRTGLLAAALLSLALIAFSLHWVVNRVEVPPGHSLLLRYKGPLLFGSRKTAQPGYWAAEGEIGVLEKMRGPGRHFYSPVWWERTVIPDTLVKPGEVGMVTCKLGDPLSEGEFLVDGEVGETKYKGVLRKVLGPGRYRINPYGYDVKVVQTETTEVGKTKKVSGWVQVPTGYVGVVTNLADNPLTKQKAGIQDKVLPPGLYPINPREQQVDVVGVGYWETSVSIAKPGPPGTKAKTDESGEPVYDQLGGGITFPSSDGFGIAMDFTAVWGLMPDQAPNAIRKFGNIEQVENKVVLPQIESICRNNGSEYAAVKLLVGSEREQFQNKVLIEFKDVLKAKDITLMYGLVRHIYIPKEVREPIQMAFVADELKLTREQEQQTARAEAEFKEAERKVELQTETVKAETEKLVAEKKAEGQKTVGETEAETRKLAAAVEKDTAELETQAKLVLGQAENEGKRLLEQAKATKFKLAVQAFGTPAAYNNWVFATGLPEKIDLKLLYAGKGTMWTDLKEAVRIMAPSTAEDEKAPPK